MISLNSRSRKWLEDNGYIAQVVETGIPKTFKKRDLFGCFDVLAVGHGLVKFIQTTSLSNASSRRKKVLASDAYKELANTDGVDIQLHLWFKKGRFWKLRIEDL